MRQRHPGNREGWLTALGIELEPLILSRTHLRTQSYKVACGWPSRRGTSDNRRAVGECWPVMDDGVAELFISPVLDDSAEIAHVVAHEMLHAFLPTGVGHRKPFSQAAKALGLIGKPTVTVAGEELAARLVTITNRLGPYPHARIKVGGPRERGRNLKFMCSDCGYIGRTSAYWLDTVGAPLCPQCIKPMTVVDAVAGSPLEVCAQTTEFRLPGDNRFVLRFVRGACREAQWFVLDFGTALLSDIPPRMTVVGSRQEALDLVKGLSTGLTTWDTARFDDSLTLPLHDQFLDDDEDERADYPEDQIQGSFPRVALN